MAEKCDGEEKMAKKLGQRVYVPGEEITTEEEFMAGKNTFAKNGIIRAKTTGVANFDDENKFVRMGGKSVSEIKEGDIVHAKVVLVKESNVVVELLSAEGGKKITVKGAQIPVRNVSTDYISNLKPLFKIGDIVKAKVNRKSPLGIDLSTNEKGLGVTKAYCSNCRSEMGSSHGKLMCLKCGSMETRRWFEDDLAPRQFGGHDRDDRGPRRDFGGHREGGFRGGDRGRSFGGGHGGSDRGFGGHSSGRNFENNDRSFGGRDNRGPRSFGGHERNRGFDSRRREGDRGFGSRNN